MRRIDVVVIDFINEEFKHKMIYSQLTHTECCADDIQVRKTLYAVRIWESNDPEDYYDYAVFNNFSDAAFTAKGIKQGKIRPKGIMKQWEGGLMDTEEVKESMEYLRKIKK